MSRWPSFPQHQHTSLRRVLFPEYDCDVPPLLFRTGTPLSPDPVAVFAGEFWVVRDPS